MDKAWQVIRFLFYALLIILAVILVWTIYSEYKTARAAAANAAVAWGQALRNALDPTKETFFIWKLPVLNWTQPLSQGIGAKLKGWFTSPTGAPGGGANPMNQSPTGEQAVQLNPNFPPSIARQVTPLLSQPDPVQQPPTQNTGTDGTSVMNGTSTPVDNVVPFVVSQPASSYSDPGKTSERVY